MPETTGNPSGVDIRPATQDDYDEVVSFTQDTWGEDSDYIPRVFDEWLDEQGDGRMTLVAEIDGTVAGLAQAVMLSPTESWGQGMRVNPDYRGEGVGTAVTDALFEWSRDQGAVVMRNMVFSWNQAGLGQSRAVGYDPATEFRWLQPEPAAGEIPDTVTDDVDAAWAFWTDSDAREALAGLGLDMDESWALRELTPDLLARAAAETSLLAVTDDAGTNAMAYRTRTYDRENEDGETETWAEYGVGAWASVGAAETLITAIKADAADLGADRTRILIPETPQFVTDGAYLRANISEEPDFVMAADLTGQ